jgi:hypothetical protein
MFDWRLSTRAISAQARDRRHHPYPVDLLTPKHAERFSSDVMHALASHSASMMFSSHQVRCSIADG